MKKCVGHYCACPLSLFQLHWAACLLHDMSYRLWKWYFNWLISSPRWIGGFGEFQFMYLITYRVSQYLCPPIHSRTGQWHTLNLYIFVIPHQFQINLQDFRSPTWFAHFRWRVFWVRAELNFVYKFFLNFWGEVTKIATKDSIIDVDPYMIPHTGSGQIKLVIWNLAC